jgi:hypothetical protein
MNQLPISNGAPAAVFGENQAGVFRKKSIKKKRAAWVTAHVGTHAFSGKKLR